MPPTAPTVPPALAVPPVPPTVIPTLPVTYADVACRKPRGKKPAAQQSAVTTTTPSSVATHSSHPVLLHHFVTSNPSLVEADNIANRE
jgi:hypothetical protein